MRFNIAVGKSRLDKKWQNKQVTWEQFLKKIETTHRTVETVEDYVSFKKERQDEIKDVGGFVGGHLAGGRRLVGSITSRQLLTFDADEADVDFWEKFCLQYDCAAAIYSTHKHTPEKPRYRLVIPMSREILCDEYSAIMRRLAGDIGIDQFDVTGYQPHRLMYWPSTSSNGEYIYKTQDGEWLNPDEILATYRNWQDVSEWPIGIRENKILTFEAKKQGEPVDKPGLIGAFNRAYTISEAIEKYLPEVYLPCDIDGRYTYAEGSTGAGVVIYDNKFSFSHHSTDPASNVLCNAFDLVRLHKFSLMDEGSELPINKRPSYLAMSSLVSNDTLVKQQLGEAKLHAAQEAFGDIGDAATKEIDLDWLKEMDVDRKGNYLLTINNVALILEHDPIFSDNIAFDEFKQQAILKRNTPWRDVDEKPMLNDNDLANIENYIEKVYKLSSGTKLNKGLLVVLERFSFHPITTYLRSLKWDGVNRLDTLLIDYLGAEDNKYTRNVTRKSLVACAARVLQPGIKFDNVLTLVGEEGQGKSALWDKLGGKWFSDTFNLHMLQSKEAYEQIQGVWIIEIGELAGMAKVEVERIKSFISARQDNYRSPYGRTTEQRLRQCVFFASTNTTDFLKSQNGNRRFWPVATFIKKPKESVYSINQQTIDQIWAEACHLFSKGEELYLSQELVAEAKKVQNNYTEQNPLVEQIEAFLNMKLPQDWYNKTKFEKVDFMSNYKEIEVLEDLVERTKICKYEIWELVLMSKEPLNMYGNKLIQSSMDKIEGWKKTNAQVRFGTSYPRHKGSYEKIQVAYTLQELLN
jgi:predicted P-loop ATPase